MVGLLLALAYGLQAVQVFLLPVPSSFSTVSLLAERLRQGGGPPGPSAGRLLFLAFCALGSLLAALLPLVVCLLPGVYAFTLPLMAPRTPLTIGACLALVLGSAISLAAVLSLRAKAVFDASGETNVLITSGVFSLFRHPVLAGLGLIYLGFVLLLPSWLLVCGFVLFLLNAGARMDFEEAELARRFGAAYQAYATSVGRLGPRRVQTSL